MTGRPPLKERGTTMADKEVVNVGNVVKFAGAFIAFLIGAGFATGQEIMQYFTSYGYQGLLTTAAILILFLYVSIDFISVGYREDFKRGSEVFGYYCGKYVGAFYDYFTILFVFMSYVVMIAGSGATLNQHYGLPTAAGGILMMVMAGGTVIFGLGKIVDVIGKIGPFIVVIAIGLGAYGILSNIGAIAENANLIAQAADEAAKSGAGKIMITSASGEPKELLRAGNTWYASASSYVGFCMLWLAAFLTAMGKQANSLKEARLGVSLGAIGFCLGCLTLMFGLLAYLPETVGENIPSLILAVKINPSFAVIFSVIIMAGIYTTGVPLLWQVSSRFTEEKSKNFVIATIALAAIGCFIGLALPFKTIVNYIYVLNGYVGILLIFFMFAKGFMPKKAK